MAYTKNMWHTGDPITQALMNNIENGIEEALAKANNAQTTADTAKTTNDRQDGSLTSLTEGLTTVNQSITTINNEMASMDTRIKHGTENGTRAWEELINVGVEANDINEVTKSLLEVLNAKYASLLSIQNALATPDPTDEVKVQGQMQRVGTLAQRIQHIYDTLTTLNASIVTEHDRIGSSNQRIGDLEDAMGGISGCTVAERLNALDGGNMLTNNDLPRRNIKNLTTEIENAYLSHTYGDNSSDPPVAIQYNNLKARFEADEAKIKNIETEIGAAHRIGILDENEDVINDTLDMRFDDIDGGNKPSRTLPSVISEVETARDGAASLHARLSAIDNTQDANSVIKRVETLEQTMPNKVNTSDIYSGLNIQEGVTGKVLDAQYGRVLNEKIGGNFTSQDTVASHIGNLETEIGNARPYTEDEQTGERTYGTLDDRFDTIEGRATQLETEINEAHVNNGTLDDRFDAIESAATGLSADVTAIEEEIRDAHRDENDTLDTRFDDIESDITNLSNAIDHVQGENDEFPNGLAQRITAVEASLTEQGGINDRLDAIDNATTGAIKTLQNTDTGFEQRIHNLELNPSSATVIVSSLPEQGDASKDYLLGPNKSGQYFYYKWIVDGAEDNWKLISGGVGGTGSSSGIILSELPSVSVGDPNIDYFIGDNSTGYIHYRFIKSQTPETNDMYIKVLPTGIINDIEVEEVSIESAAEADKWPTTQSFSGGLEAYALEDTEKENNLLADFVAVRNARISTVYDENDELQSQKLQILDTNGKLMEYDIVGGGGGASTLYNARIESTTAASRSIPTNNTDPVTINAKVIIQQGNTILPNATAEGVIQYRQRNTSVWNTGDRIEVEANIEDEKYTIINDTVFTIDITKYLKEDVTMEFRIMLTVYPAGEDDTFTTYSSTFRVSQVNISIAAESFDYASVKTGNFQFNYRCFGPGIQKTVHFLLDGEDIVEPRSTNLHNTVLYQTIDMTGQENGMHTFQVYFITNTGLESNKLNYFILYNTDATRIAPLIGAAAERTSITDGDEIIVNYSVYTPGSETTDTVTIELYQLDENDKKESLQLVTLNQVTNNVLVDPPYRTFAYPRLKKEDPSDPEPDPITVYITLTASHTVSVNGVDTVLTDSQTVSVQINYLNTKYDLEPAGENNLLYSYTAYGRSNNDAVKDVIVYPYKTIGGQTINFKGTFNNFNWATDGYVDGESLIIGGGAKYNIDVPIFSQAYNNISFEENANISDITENGRTIEIDYEVLSTTKMDAEIIKCMGDNGVGFCVTPQNCYLVNSGSHIDIDSTGFIKNEENVAAAYLNPGMRTHLTFVIEPWASSLAADGNYHQSANIYINGEFANACPYNRNSTTGALDGNDFTTDATITIGSDTCLIKLYSIKLYNRGLTESQVLHNYEVAPVATRNKLTRLDDNDVLNELGQVDYEKARKKYTCLLLTGPGTINGVTVPTMAPYKGYFSPMGRQKDGKTVGKTESGLLLTKPNPEDSKGYTIEFNLQDKLKDPNGYGFASSNNVQGTSSQKFPVKNLKVYLAKGKAGTEIRDENINIYSANTDSITTAVTAAYTTVHENQEIPEYITNCAASIAEIIESTVDPTQESIVAAIIDYLNNNDTDVGAAYTSPGDELIITHPIIPGLYTKSEKVKYPLRDKALGTVDNDSLKESTLCWKADYMSTDHANTFNANIVNSLYSTNDRLSDRWTDKTQYAVYGIKCLLFQQNGENATPQFVGDGCLNNDKGNHKTFGLETDIENVWTDDGNDTMCQKWDFRNNTSSLLFFKHDGIFEMVDGKPAGASCLECIYPDEGDLADEQEIYKEENNGASNPKLDVNYNHFQILSSWIGNRANYWYEDNPTIRAQKKQIFIDEFRNHFNFNHILIYYLFMEYTALCDNRVKNIHMRTDNAGEEKIRIKNTNDYYFEGNSNPNSGPWTLAENLETRIKQEPLIDENGDYQFDQSGNMVLGDVSHVFVKDSVLNTIDWEQGEDHSNFAIWAPVLYDLDSCFSVDNVGYLKIRYDATWTYSLYNKLKFAGFDSILWLQVEDCFQDELKAKAKELYNKVIGLNYSTFYRQHITDNLASLCPAITNQDMILKFEAPWTNGFIDYSTDPPKESTDKYKYLQRGTRTFQKASFMKQRSLLLSSKYDANEFKQDKITFRAGTEVNQEYAVLTLVANQKLYHGVQYGDLNDVTKVTRRASKIYNADTDNWDDITDGLVPEFVPCIVKNTGNMGNTDGIEIYGASVLNDIGDISRFHPWQLKVGNAINLKKLILGSSASGFSNTSTTEIDGISACSLLEEINICNLKNLTSLSLSRNGFIKKVYATGSGLKTLSLPHGGVLNTVAYGDATTDITIINQKKLENFEYENSSTNHYSNVNRLWIENTPNVPIVDIINYNLSSLTAGIRLIGIDIDLYPKTDNPPEQEINTALDTTTLFLNTLVSDIAKGKRLNSSGGLALGQQYPEITGKVHIAMIRDSLLQKLKACYPNLIIYAIKDVSGNPIEINGNDIIQEFEIRYYNYGYQQGESDEVNAKWLLYTDHRTDKEHFIDPVSTYVDDLDPVTGLARIGIPQKPSDPQYIYTFGTYTTDENNNLIYDRFSGWKRYGADNNPSADDYVQGDTIFIAQYPTTTDQYYTVNWYAEPNESAIQTIPAKYGTDITLRTQPEENSTFIRAKQDKNGVYKVFKGWDRPIGKLTENTNIYAIWETSSIGNSIQSVDMSQLTAADLYAISNLGANARNNILNNKLQGATPISIKMGNDFYYTSGVNTTDLLNGAEKIRLTGESSNVQIKNNITPLNNLASDWTIGIDYKLLMDSTLYSNGREFVLLSCYRNADSSIQGFKISLAKGSVAGDENMYVHVTWGNATTSTAVDTITLTGTNNAKKYCKSYRNVIILRHSASEPEKLYIYSTGFNTPVYNSNTEIYATTLTWTNRTALSNTPLILGGNYSGTSTTIETSSTRRPAKAIVYWAKYWDTDLGRKNCRLLAAWPHETEYFVLTGYDNNQGDHGETSTRMMPGTKLSFAAASGIGDRAVEVPILSDNTRAGWYSSSLRTLCNERIFNAFPITYRSIIGKYTIISTYFNAEAASSPYTTEPSYGEIETQDYIYLASEQEVGGNVSTSFKEDESLRFWPWLSANNLKIFVASEDGLIDANLASINPLRYRFLGRPFTTDTRVFYNTTNPANMDEWIYRYVDSNGVQHDEQISVQSGDVWYTDDPIVNADFNSSAGAYIYYTNAEINEGVYVDIITTNGGWKRACMQELRTYHDDGSMTYAKGNRFDKINEQGALILPTSDNAGSTSVRIICPEFSI